MKKMLALILSALLLISAVPAAAQPMSADEMGMHGEELCVYVGEGNLLYAVDEPEPLIEDRVLTLEYASDTTVLYTIAEETNEDFDREATLVALDLSAEPPEHIDVAANLTAAIWSPEDRELYFVTHDEPSVLKTYDPMRDITEDACDAGEPIERLRLSIDGLLVNTEGWEKLYVPVTRSLEEPIYPARNATIQVGDQFETLLDADGALLLRADGSDQAVPLAQPVSCSAIEGGIVYYIDVADLAAPRFMAHTIETGTTAEMYIFGEEMGYQLAVGEDGYAFMLSQSGIVYRYTLQSGEYEPFCVIDVTDVHAPVIRSFDGLLLVYDAAGSDGETFMSMMETGAPALPAVEAVPVAPAEELADDYYEGDEETAAALADDTTPLSAGGGGFVTLSAATATAEEFTTLSPGSRGAAVTRLQQKLRSLGYLTASADGVYGKATQVAVTYLQGDMGFKESGSAGVRFQHEIYYGKPPKYERYRALSQGKEGIRVREMQERLRTKYYMTVNAGGHYQEATAAAVRRFQKQNGYSQASKISAAQLKKLFSSSCPDCKEYYTLQKGDSAPAVKKLNARLKALGYLAGSAGSSYQNATVAAIKLFQSENGLLSTGKCTGNLQRMIYDKNAKHHGGRPAPAPTPKPSSKQVVTDKQVKVVRDYLNKRYGKSYDNKKAVARLQKRLIDLEYMDSGQATGIYDARTKSAVQSYQWEEFHVIPQSGVAGKQTLAHLFP